MKCLIWRRKLKLNICLLSKESFFDIKHHKKA